MPVVQLSSQLFYNRLFVPLPQEAFGFGAVFVSLHLWSCTNYFR